MKPIRVDSRSVCANTNNEMNSRNQKGCCRTSFFVNGRKKRIGSQAKFAELLRSQKRKDNERKETVVKNVFCAINCPKHAKHHKKRTIARKHPVNLLKKCKNKSVRFERIFISWENPKWTLENSTEAEDPKYR